MSVLILHPFQHLATSIIIKVGIDIRQRDTVRVQETLKQQVVLQGVYLRDTQTIGDHRPGCGATTWSHHHPQLVTCRVDEVLHDKKVTRETHRLHDMQLKTDTVVHLLHQWVAIPLSSTFIGKFGKIVCLKLDSI